MLKQIEANDTLEDKTLLGSAQPSKARVDRLMEIIEAEPAYVRQKQANPLVGTKKFLVAAALMLALLITPFNGTTFAGEIVNWANKIVVTSGQTMIEAINVNKNFVEPDNLVETQIDQLDVVLEQLGSDHFDTTTIPEGYTFDKAMRLEYDPESAYRFEVYYSNQEGDQMIIGYNFDKSPISPTEVPGSISIRVEGNNLKYSEVDFLNTKALLGKSAGHYQINPEPIIEDADGFRIQRWICVAYSIKGHQPDWAEGKAFLEKWYQSLSN